MTNATTLDRPPIAVGPLIPLHRKSGASIEVQSGWEVAQSYPSQPSRSSNALIDLTGRFVTEISGPETDQWLKSYCNGDVAIRDVKSVSGCDVYRLTNVRAIVFSQSPIDSGVNVTGGWASIGLFGPEALSILQKMTAIDLRDSALGI
ncbi:MAG: hypothetical protein FJ267_19895, partial [Planctomycetes bacterium]|nr:hypothetical protein [Planctomycetota bacterium]